MKNAKLLPTAIILGFCIAISACAEGASSEAAEPNEPIAPASLTKGLLDKVVKKGVPQDVATLAFNKYEQFSARVQNTNYITIIDFTRHSGKPRLWMINTKTADVDALNVAHGAGSDPNDTGIPQKFSNVPDSKMSSLGAYLVSEKFQSMNHGTAMRLDGLESTNDMVRDRAIIIHSASYVSSAKSIMGMSWGCPAISLDWIGRALQRLSGGSFMYAYGNPAHVNQQLDDMQIQAIMLNPAYKWVNESEEAPPDGAR